MAVIEPVAEPVDPVETPAEKYAVLMADTKASPVEQDAALVAMLADVTNGADPQRQGPAWTPRGKEWPLGALVAGDGVAGRVIEYVVAADDDGVGERPHILLTDNNEFRWVAFAALTGK